MSRRDLISLSTRTQFREFLVHSTLGEIENMFSAEGLEPDRDYDPQLSGQRRSYVEQYYHGMDFTDPADVRRLMNVYEEVLADCEARLDTESAFLKPTYDKLLRCLRRDGYEFDGGHLREKGSSHIALRHLTAATSSFDGDYLTAQLDRLAEAVEQDPDLAIGQAKELIETCCRTILAARDESEPERSGLLPLVKTTMKSLQLLPEGVPESAKGAKSIKAVLGSLAAIAQGMAELRNLYGTGHGRHAKHKGLPARHAKLAVGVATTLTLFLFETHAERVALGHPRDGGRVDASHDS